MQTITLEFKKLERLPVPESRNELIFIKNEFGDVRCSQAKSWAARFMFDEVVDPTYTYAHVKVTATETDFKVGDRVKAKGWRKPATIKAIDTFAIIEFEQPTNLPNYTTPLTDLTLITQ